MDPFVGQIILWPVPWVPEGWALCDGSTLNVQQYAALFSLIGITYGGNGSSTFQLPDLRSKVPLGSQVMQTIGQASGAASASVTAVGSGSVTVGVNNMPSHTHTATFTPGASTSVNVAIPVDSGGETDNVPGTTLVLGKAIAGLAAAKIYSSNPANTTLKPFSASVVGGGGTIANANTGGGQAIPFTVSVPVSVSTLQPALTMNYIIALTGIYPPRP
ncbi:MULTISPECIES: phage tail protein [Rugamonas]|jgi:microcystin-dependent protein|uniref:Microcystin-dependent protein n=1 Tax=Rugamonas rubra TaxID=758825 RepID=A0A1I4MRP4_9BURK|nr:MULTISPECIES: tail fiber protein [Rugamonas]WGG51955.1 tail fiber protein [Rugamonas sp. DEMB1]SFM05919.1 Microcystin-dependent protein [Rugamonas rubra]